MGERYAVQCGRFSGEIHAGRVNKEHTAFTSKEDVTGQVLHAVADWVERNHDGGALVPLPDGRSLDIDVTTKTVSEVARLRRTFTQWADGLDTLANEMREKGYSMNSEQIKAITASIRRILEGDKNA